MQAGLPAYPISRYAGDPYLKYRPAFARSLPVQILLTGVVLTLVAVLFIHLIFTAQYHWPLAPVNYVLQISGVSTLLISLVATLHVVLAATMNESEHWPYMLSYLAVNVPPTDNSTYGWSIAERATWLIMNASTSGLIQITHIQFLTLLYPSRMEARLIFALLGPLAVVAAIMQLIPIGASASVNNIASAVRNVCNATLSLLFTSALFVWGLLVKRHDAWRTDGGTAAFGCAALTLALLSTGLNFLYVPREEEYMWLPPLMWAVVLWQSFLGWWWWVGAGNGYGYDEEEFERLQRRKEKRAARKLERKNQKKKPKTTISSILRQRRPPPAESSSDPEPNAPVQRSATSAASISSSSTSPVFRFLPGFVHHWYSSLRYEHAAAARQQAAERQERIGRSDPVRNGWGLGSFAWRTVGLRPGEPKPASEEEEYELEQRTPKHHVLDGGDLSFLLTFRDHLASAAMEAARYPQTFSRPSLFEDLNTFGKQESSKRRVQLRSSQCSDDEDELDLIPRPSQLPQRILSEPMPGTRDAIRKLRFKKTNSAFSSTATGQETIESKATGKNTSPARTKRITESSSSNARSVREARVKLVTSPDDPAPARPKPRPLARPVASSSTAKSKPLAKPASKKTSVFTDDESGSDSEPKSTLSASRSFPRPSPLQSSKGKARASSPTPKTRGYPAPSPLGNNSRALEGRSRNDKGKGKGKVIEPAVRPFPLNAVSPLSKNAARRESKKSAPIRPFPLKNVKLGSSNSPAKRRSAGSDEDRDKKRVRSVSISSTEQEPFDYEGDSALCLISPDTDPKMLCPFCDTRLPLHPTPLLRRLLAETRRKSYRDARPSNPLGRKAPMNVFVAVCQRHRFESEILPEADAKGWPKSIDWERLQSRVQAMQHALRAILEDRGAAIVFGKNADESDSDEPHRGPRMQCIFWRDLLRDLKNKGSKAVKSVRGQFATFEKTQPGYYGEMGAMIINQTLYNSFPLDSINPDLVLPLTPRDFMQRILIPEVGMRLVIEDMNMDVDDADDRATAVQVLRDSASYGVAMFPEDGGEWGKSSMSQVVDENDLGVADLMLLERARRRRKELEVEEREEEEMMHQDTIRETSDSKPKAKTRAKRKTEKENSDELVTIDEESPLQARPRPKALHKKRAAVLASSDMETDSSRGTIEDDDTLPFTSRSEAEPTPKPSRRPTLELSSSDELISKKWKSKQKHMVSESDSDARPPKSSPSSSCMAVVDACSDDDGSFSLVSADKTPRPSRLAASSSDFQPLAAARRRAKNKP
ncbi:unnamed protein product [Mycena citricolor]|uniref:Restriction of telomere capping protein 4 n=1 Tax=Mycena citricolor TaxID=2018698 RepID=A0AAD2HX55_9AGAR|nr:unnamed protein product [Mycena citricolor]